MSDVGTLGRISEDVSFDSQDEQPTQVDDFVTSEIQELLGDALTYVHGLGIAHYSQLQPQMLVTINRALGQATGVPFGARAASFENQPSDKPNT